MSTQNTSIGIDHLTVVPDGFDEEDADGLENSQDSKETENRDE